MNHSFDFSQYATLAGFQAIEFESSSMPVEEFRYVIIDGHLVPYAFIERIAGHISAVSYDTDSVITPRNAVGEEVWHSLSANERKVLGPCLLILIAERLLSIQRNEGPL